MGHQCGGTFPGENQDEAAQRHISTLSLRVSSEARLLEQQNRTQAKGPLRSRHIDEMEGCMAASERTHDSATWRRKQPQVDQGSHLMSDKNGKAQENEGDLGL